MAEVIRHIVGTHEVASAGFIGGHQKLNEHHSNLHSTGNSLAAVWTGRGGEQFQHRHDVLMNHLATATEKVKKLESLRSNMLDAIQDADRHGSRIWNV